MLIHSGASIHLLEGQTTNLLQGGHNFSCRVHLSNLQGLVVGRSSSSRRRETVIDAFVTIRKGLLEILLSFLCTGGVEKIWATEEQDN
jgi:hypothetical protein